MTTRQQPQQADRSRSIFPIIFTLLLLVSILGLLATGFQRFFAVGEISMPNIIGTSSDDAQRQLRSLGLEPLVFDENIANVTANVVTSQSPAAGTLVRRGRTISVGVNQPQGAIEVPYLLGLNLEQAKNTLRAINLELGEVTYAFAEIAEGQVIDSSPEAGTSLMTGERVDMVLSRGAETATISMPRMTNITVEEAKQRLRSLGFTAVHTHATSVSFDRPFFVTDQLPPAGQPVSLSTRIVLTYALSTDTVVQVPNLLGVPLAQAQTVLRSAGLWLGAVNYISDQEQPPGIVSYVPSGFTLRDVPVEITINTASLGELVTDILQPPAVLPASQVVQGQPSTSEPFQESPVEQPDSQVFADGSRNLAIVFDPMNMGIPALQERDYRFKLIVVDDQGERILLEELVAAGHSVEAGVVVYGDALLRTYINDSLFQAWNP